MRRARALLIYFNDTMMNLDLTEFKYSILICATLLSGVLSAQPSGEHQARQRISINEGWHFYKYIGHEKADSLIYDVRPAITTDAENKVADARPTHAIQVESVSGVLKPWILPSANPFISEIRDRHLRPEGNPGKDFPFTQSDFNDAAWEVVDLPHDWAIKGPFMTGENPKVGGGMGRLPSYGVAWYRKKLDIPKEDENKSVFLDVDGAMSYAIVWLNGKLVGGWPYGYNSWRLDLTSYIVPGGVNQLAIRLDNPNHSARWYPGGGIYRNVWLTKTNRVHIGHWGTRISTENVSNSSATINIDVTVDNDLKEETKVDVVTDLFPLDGDGKKSSKPLIRFPKLTTTVLTTRSSTVRGTVILKNPSLWNPLPTQRPNRYLAVTSLYQDGTLIDEYETYFGIRSLEFNPSKGLMVNGERIQIKGVNQHHDLGALGAAFNLRAAERQLELLKEMGCNAIRFAHNPPAPEFLDLTDKMGFLVFDEIFDSWELKKTPLDFHLIFPAWAEPDVRSFVRRDRNHPSVIIWGIGNEVGEQYTGSEGAAVAQKLYNIIREEDPNRPITSAMNFAKPDMAFPEVLDIISLNYQGEGIRQHPEFEKTDRIRTPPQYNAFHEKFPDKPVLSSETASAFSSRGVYLFPVSKELSAPVREGRGGDSNLRQVSAYELHAVDFGATAEKVFSAIDRHPFVAGEFVWTGWDYLGEPTPYYTSRSSYSGIIDLAGFKKDRFYLYQSHWQPELPMVHILPHWTWPERQGEITPVHVFTSGDEAELFVNGKSLGRKKKNQFEYRLRWDDVKYEPGKLSVVAYKNGKEWASEEISTAKEPAKLIAIADRNVIAADGYDLAFITVKITDRYGNISPRADDVIEFSISGPGEIVATDNGDPTNMDSFASAKRAAFSGLCLVIVRTIKGKPGKIIVTAKSPGLSDDRVTLSSK